MRKKFMLALDVHDLKKTYRDGTVALKGVSFQVKAGDCYALLGPNGAGKSTIIGILTSLVNKSSGQVKIFNVDIDEHFSLAKSYIGVVPQEFNFNIFETVEQIIINQAGFYGVPYVEAKDKAHHYLNKLDLWSKRNSQSRSLSGGMKRRLMIARAMVHEPKLLILDEPTAGVDVEIRRQILQYIEDLNRAGLTIILTTHYLEEAERLANNLAIINRGDIILQSDLPTILKQLQQETFVLNLNSEIDEQFDLPNFDIRVINSTTLEVDLNQPQNISDLFAALAKKQIHVSSLKNKFNRLEELFVKLVNHEKS